MSSNTTTNPASKQEFVNGRLYGQLVKRRKDGFCQKCNGEIKKGDQVLVVKELDGFTIKPIGLCHVECFKDFS